MEQPRASEFESVSAFFMLTNTWSFRVLEVAHGRMSCCHPYSITPPIPSHPHISPIQFCRSLELPPQWILYLFSDSYVMDDLPTSFLPTICLHPFQSSIKSMEQELHCPVCDEMVKQPILLPCQHSVCLLCAAEVLVQRGYPPPDLPSEPNSPASTPNTRSPRQGRRPLPRTPDRLERVLRTGGVRVLMWCACARVGGSAGVKVFFFFSFSVVLLAWGNKLLLKIELWGYK